MKTTALRQLIKESIQEYIREVETSGNIAAQEAKIRACEEAIALREKKANMEGLDEAYHDMMDQSKLNELKKEIKELQKYKLKTERLLEKMKSKGGKDEKEVVKDGMEEEGVVDEVTIDEMDPESGPQLEEDSLNESFLHMQKLAGLITEGEYKKKRQELNEAKIPSFRIKQVLTPFGMDKPDPQSQADLRVGLNYVIPKKSYSGMSDIQQHMGKVTKIEGDKVFLETPKGEQQYKISDLVYISNASS